MQDFSTFLQDLAMVLCVAAVATILFHRIKQPPILGYLLAGLLLGPHVSFFPFFAHEGTVKTLAELGVILVMFSIGLEFSIERLIKVLPTAGLTSVIEISVMGWLGFTAGHVMGWTFRESIFAGAIIAISSTMISSRALKEQNADPRLTQMVFGILVVQDLAAILLLALLTPMAQGSHLSISGLVTTTGSLLGFLSVLFGVGFLLIPRAIRLVISLRNTETLLVTTVGICFAMALLAQKGGYSVALGAFLAGMLVGESGATATIERLIHPLRDMFSAVFFVAVGMLVDPAVLLKHWGAVLLLTTLVIVGQTATVSVGAFLSGRPLKSAIQAGMSLSQVGEFSFIIAQVGVAYGAVGSYVYDVAVAVSVVTAFTTPWFIRYSGPFSRFVDSHLPKPLQTFTTLYGSWLERLRHEDREVTFGKRIRRLVGFLMLDTFLLIVVIITTAATINRWLPQLRTYISFPEPSGKFILAGVGFVLAIPFMSGILRGTRTLGSLLAKAAIPEVKEGDLDLGFAPRRVLTLAIQMGILFAVGFPLLAATQPFLPFGYSPVLLGFLVAVLGAVFWKSAVNLQGHVQAGAQMVAEALSTHAPQNQDVLLEEIDSVVPGMGAPTSTPIPAGCNAVGKTLAQLNLRSLTGASVIAITRGTDRHLMPSGKEQVEAGDILVLVGTQEAITSASALLKKTGS